MPDARPNVLLLLSDQHSKYHIGCYGDPLVRTPNLDRLAETGLRFTSARCGRPGNPVRSNLCQLSAIQVTKNATNKWPEYPKYIIFIDMS